MKDPLESYILDRKQELEVYDPDDRLWERIDQELHAHQRQALGVRLWRIAAAVALVAAIGLSLWWFTASQRAAPLMAEQAQPEVKPQDLYSPELAEVEAYYSTMISNRREQIKAYKSMGIDIDDDAFDQLDELKQQYEDLQKELLNTENAQIIVNAMIQNLSTQMEVLNQQLMILEQIKSMQHENKTSI